jgi:hypothetical protein
MQWVGPFKDELNEDVWINLALATSIKPYSPVCILRHVGRVCGVSVRRTGKRSQPCNYSAARSPLSIPWRHGRRSSSWP